MLRREKYRLGRAIMFKIVWIRDGGRPHGIGANADSRRTNLRFSRECALAGSSGLKPRPAYQETIQLTLESAGVEFIDVGDRPEARPKKGASSSV
jgi:hypothetical protein